MPRRLNITAARNQLLSLPERLAPGEAIEVVRHQKTVLKIIRTDGEGARDPFALLDQALARLPKTRRTPPKALAAHYKDYLYGKKG